MNINLTPTGDAGTVRHYSVDANGFRNVTATYDFVNGDVTVEAGTISLIDEDGTETTVPAPTGFAETREVIALYVELDGLRLRESDTRQAWVFAGMTRAPREVQSKLRRQLTALEKKRAKLEQRIENGLNEVIKA